MIIDHAKSLLKQFASPVLDGLGLYDRQLRRYLSTSSWTVVMYHRVIDDPAMDPFSLGMCVTRRHFDEQLRYFKRHFTPIGLSAAVDTLARGEALPDRALSVTFDDGYLDNLTTALPVLKLHGISAALFVPTGGLDDDQPLWWDRVIHALASTSHTEFAPADLGLPLSEQRLSLRVWHRRATVERVLDSLWTLPIEQVLAVVSRIERHFGPGRPGVPMARRLNSAQVRQMHLAGVEIGAHSVRHPNLTLESPAVVREEMLASRRLLETLCDAPINGFAYPAGWKNADAEAAAKEAGFRYAMATVRGVNDRETLNLYSLARVGMPDTGVSDLKRALSSVRPVAGSGSPRT